MFRMLRVDLTTQDVSEDAIEKDTIAQFLGGRGLGAKILYEELTPGTNPLGPQNKLLFLTSPLLGTEAPSCVKYCVVTKSPLSGTILMSLAGGFFGCELRRAGYDVLIIEGKSERPVYLLLDKGEVQIGKAEYLWGMPTDETQHYLKERLGEGVRIACVGPTAERLVPFTSIISDKRAVGRGGAGAVMASKNLKAIVVRGKKEVGVADSKGLHKTVSAIRKKYRESDRIKRFGKYCTPRVLDFVNERGIFPTRNYQSGVFEGANRINAEAHQKLVVRKLTCYKCPVVCSNLAVVREGPYRGAVTEGPEYQTLWSFGGQCGNDCLEAIIAADEICDKFGVDTISAGNIIGFAMECYERGIITREDTGGIDLRFGNHQAMIQMLRNIAVGEGLGEVLAKGVRRAAEIIGKDAERYAMQVKGLEMAGYDPRGAKGMGISFATSPRGGCHERGLVTRETFGSLPPIDRFSLEGKGKVVMEVQDEMTVLDSLGICVFPLHNGGMDIFDVADLFSSATGIKLDSDQVMKAGERIWNVERMFNLREGFGRKDDTLPERFLKEPMPEGPSKGHVVELNQLLADYYSERGWDKEGKPVPGKLEELGLQGLFGRSFAYSKNLVRQGGRK
ncbi:MAG: aldehyde ferredoxin oxidoreductase family protein [Candidatus Aerophobetes bacterium]